MPAEDCLPLDCLRAGESATVRYVADEDPALLRHLGAMGMLPEVKLSVKNYCELDGNLTIQIEGRESAVVLGTAVTSQVFVEKR
jgi:Fe2+ transport system protein FeoA